MTRARDLAAGTFEQATGGVLKLETSDTTVTDGSVLGKIEFKAPDEASGTDAILVGAAIEAVAEGTFAADNNATELVFKTGASAAADTKMILTSGGNVGIGVSPTTSYGNALQIHDTGTSGANLRLTDNTSGSGTGNGFEIIQIGVNNYMLNRENGFIAAYTNNTERMRLTAAGELLVGVTSSSANMAGVEIAGNGQLYASTSSSSGHFLNIQGSSGDILSLRSAGATVGSITSGPFSISASGANNTGWSFGDNSAIEPMKNQATADNLVDLGSSSKRMDDIFATNGTIQTSDKNEKQDIASLTSAEMLVAKRISSLFKTFRWKDKVAAKGNDARTHSGIIAQDVQAAFTAEGLDAGDYSLFISSTWWEHDVDVRAVDAADAVDAVYRKVTDSDGNEINELVTPAKEAVEAKDAYTRTDTYDTEDEAPEGATSKTRMGIRYPELLSFVAAYNEQRFAAIETRLTALEG